MLDRVEPEVVAPLLGEALGFQVVDRIGLTSFQVETNPDRPGESQSPLQQHEPPAEFARVLLPAQERVRDTVVGWPTWFTRAVGRGKVLFTTLGPRGCYRPRAHTDPASPYDSFPFLPVATPHPEAMAYELMPAFERAQPSTSTGTRWEAKQRPSW